MPQKMMPWGLREMIWCKFSERQHTLRMGRQMPVSQMSKLAIEWVKRSAMSGAVHALSSSSRWTGANLAANLLSKNMHMPHQ